MLGYRSLTGKDTFFSFAKDLDYKRLAFADCLKDTVADLYNFSHEQMHGDYKDVEDTRYLNLVDPKTITVFGHLGVGVRGVGPPIEIPNPDYKKFLTPRRVLQIFGQDQRKLFPDIWASYIFNTKVPELISQGHTKIVITDFRFRNEADVALRWSETRPDIDLKLINIKRDVIARSGANDISENDLNTFSKWHYTLDNNSTLVSFGDKVTSLLATLHT